MELLVLIAGVLVLFRVLAWNYVKALWTTGWHTIRGTVELGSVEEHEIRFLSYYVARIDYSYSAGNEYHSGHFERVFVRERSADTFVASMKGKPVFIRSSPSRPEQSALLKQDQPGGWPA
jgi:hypothetical protein